MLHCALLAYASAFSDNPEIRSPPFRARFAQYAKQWFDYEFERPLMALVRALALLAEYHCGIGERGAGYMYMGMSIRAARSLFLKNDKPWVNEGAAVSPELELVERDWHFWLILEVYSVDKVMALEFKQKYDLLALHLGVSLPSINTELDNQPWSDGLTGFPPRLTTKTFFDSCKLMVISARIIELLYDKHPVTPDEQLVINIHLQLDTWFNNLPRELLIRARSTSPLPHLITLHIYYWFLIICLHQPFYGRSDASEDTSGGGLSVSQGGSGGPIHHVYSGHDDRSIKMVDRATHKIVQFLQIFEQKHGMVFFPRNMVHVVYECGIVLLKEPANVLPTAAKKRATALEAANTCLRALRGTSSTWPWAERLASQLEGRLNEVRANHTTQPFISDWSALWGENDQIEQTFYPFVQVWDAGVESPSGSSFMNQPSGTEMDLSGMVLSTNQLGLELSPHQRHVLGNPVTLGSLGGTGGSVDLIGTEAGVRDAMQGCHQAQECLTHYPDKSNSEPMWDTFEQLRLRAA